MVTSQIEIGGEELSTLTLAKELLRRGHEVAWTSITGPLLHEIKDAGIDFYEGPLNGRSPYSILQGGRFVRKLIKQNKFQIVHCQSIVPSIMSSIASIGTGAKVIWHDRGIRENSYKWVGKIFNFLIDYIVTNSDYELNMLKHNGLKTKKMKRIHNCINIELPTYPINNDVELRKEFGFSDSDVIIGTVRRLHPEKGGHFELIEAARDIIEMNQKVHFVVVGGGILENEMRKKSRDLGISENFIITGLRRDVERFYRIFDIFILPSEWEPFGNVLVEAMAFGVPVIATTVGGIPEIIKHGFNGILIEGPKIGLITKAIEELIKYPEKANILGDNGRKFVEKYFIPTRVADEMVEIYSQLARGVDE